MAPQSFLGRFAFLCVCLPWLFGSSLATPTPPKNGTCTKTKVVILGAGMTGIAAAQALYNASVTDFIIVDVNDYIGGRVKHTTFGKNASTSEPYVVELGANWVQGLVSPEGPENPIWTLAKKWGLENTYSNYSMIQTYDQHGAADFAGLLDDYETAYATVEQDAGTILTDNLQDRTMRTGLSIADWKPKKNMQAQAAEWWEFDWEYSYSPDQSSQTFSIINFNDTFYQFSDENNFVIDQRGFNYMIEGEAYTFLTPNDTRLRLSTNVTSITYSSYGVIIGMADGSCIQADYAVCTFSLGVLQNDVVTFDPVLPAWKQASIEGMQMGTYTKIFFQFPPSADGTFFWEHGDDAATQFFLYADPTERGYYPVFQSLNAPDFIPGSGIFFVTVVYAQSYRAEQQSNDATKAEVMEVLRTMFGSDIPDPIDFMYPRWSTEPWAYGSYSNWPPGLSLETHQNLRANLGRLWFAGEATSVGYFGFLQGAYTEGQFVGNTIAGCLGNNKTICKNEASYSKIRGCTTSERQLTANNGWFVSSMQTFGFEE
ncbi:FAD/NAD(P)-binding protein [Glarea lozoyensis ATCC 20868]|uniref:Amine oxidase n=1 Tax=Glarea lozoyensis (strain ATCC 20868 / MF5171) TaxID=1116229 RepID=S3DMT8_GLAL2|nr:FAD/NAD(P)-binding protein [Glarea lozoyensis ATCC 20868]EPE27798.1 FAD/NAD(P)-binding protein [Glarea lozoyensis ATCC 20868]